MKVTVDSQPIGNGVDHPCPAEVRHRQDIAEIRKTKPMDRSRIRIRWVF